MKLFYRFFFILLAFSLLPVAGMGVWVLSSRQAVHDNARYLHGRVAAIVADSAERTLEQMNRTLGVVQDLELAHGQEKVEVPALRRAAALDSEVALISILDKSGFEIQRLSDPDIFPSTTHLDRSTETLVVEGKNTGKLTIGSPFMVGKKTLVPVIHPLIDGRALYMVYSLRGLQRRMRSFGDGGRGKVLLVNSDGKPVPGLGDEPPMPDWYLDLKRGEGDFWESIDSPKGTWIAATSPVPTLGWYAVSIQLREDAYAESEAAASRAAIMLVVLCVVVAVGAFALSRRLLTPVSVLVGGAQRVAGGDFSHPIPPLGWGELDGLGKTFNAMTEKVRHYQELHVERVLEEKAKVDTLVRNIPEGVLLVGYDGKIGYSNATATKVISGGKPLVSISDLTRFPEIKGIIENIIKGTKKRDSVQVELPVRGEEIPEYYSCLALPVVREGREVGVLVLIRDVSTEHQIEQMKDEFFHAVIHDLRGPITVIDGMVHFMKNLKLGDRETRYVDLAKKASSRLSELIGNILEIAKLESGTMKLTPVHFSAISLLTTVHDMSRVPSETKNVTVSIDAQSASAGELTADSRLLDRVLSNLIGNALKFTPREGKITLGAIDRGAEVEFFVRDTGPGIPADKVDAVFEKFKQLDRDAATRAGYGLGLSICKKIVEVHGGRIWVESKEGQGSRFAFIIPRVGQTVESDK
jgi:signal transduction histidine kinase/HAMP domain-containing protein